MACLRSVLLRDGNGYPKPETRWGFTPLGYGFGSIFIPMGLLMGINVYPTGSWVRVWVNFHTHGFVNGHKCIPDGFMGTGLFL
jgi:hypothetical protein